MEKNIIFSPENKLDTLKVAIVHDFLVNMGGAERVTQALTEIFPKAPIYTLLYDSKIDEFFSGKKIIVSALQYWHKIFRIPVKFLFSLMPQAIEDFDFSDYNLVISSNNSFAGGIITGPTIYHLSYCHSPTRYLWDASHTYIHEQKLPRWIASWVNHQLSNLRIWDRLSAGRVDKYITNSNYVKRRMKKYYRRDAQVIYPPVDIHKIKPKSGHSDYFLIISRLVSYKKIDLAIKACNALELPLIIIGEGPEKPALEKIAGTKIEFLGWCDDKNKIEYLRNSRALIFPGEEDFGIVPIEAMAAGKPVIAFNKGGVKESVIENETGLFFNEPNVESLILALRRFFVQEKKFDYKVISQHAAKFSKNQFKDDIINLVKKIISKQV